MLLIIFLQVSDCIPILKLMEIWRSYALRSPRKLLVRKIVHFCPTKLSVCFYQIVCCRKLVTVISRYADEAVVLIHLLLSHSYKLIHNNME